MKKFSKILAIVMSFALIFALASCGEVKQNENNETTPVAEGTDYSNVKIGFIFLHDPSASTYDNNFYQGALAAQKKLGLKDDQVMFKWNVPEEGSDCYDTASEFVDEGCNIVFADSFGHESNMKLAAADNPEVQFCHATGTQGVVAGLANYHNAFASIYEGRYLAGVAAGLKLNEMIESGKITPEQAKIGYVGAHPYAEVKSGYTSFFLGVRSVCETATMEVTFTNSWFDIALEKEGALNLINDGCVLISQHADSEGAPKACEEKGVPNISYNKSTIDLGPTTAIISSKINWEPYFEMIIKAVAAGEAIPNDWCGTVATGSVELTEINEVAAAEGTAEKLEEVKAKLESGEIKVYDTSTFTVTRFDDKYNQFKADVIKTDAEGHVTSYLADVKDMGDYIGETEVIVDGYFNESGDGFRSAPYFDLDIDGITLI